MKTTQVILGIFLSIFLCMDPALYAANEKTKENKTSEKYSETQKKLLQLGLIPREETDEQQKEAIKVYQRKLKEMGYYLSAIDGIAGPLTFQALTAFQRDSGLAINGKFDRVTLGHLSRPVLILTTQDFPPFHYAIQAFKDKVYGPIPEVIKIACIGAHITCLFRLYDWGQAQELVKTEQAHGMFVIGWNAERAKFLHRSVPVVETEYGFFVRDDDPMTFRQIADVAGYTVGVYGPSNTSRTLQQIANTLQTKGLQIHIKETKDDKPLFQELATAKSIRAVFSNKDVGNTIINGLGLKNIRYAGKYKSLLYYVGFSQKLVDVKTVEAFNAQFLSLQIAGVVQEIYANSGLIGTIGSEPPASKPPAKQQTVAKAEPVKERYALRIVNNNELIEDTSTCLLWQRNGSDTQITWNEAKQYVASLNTTQYAGYADWRMPTTQELTSLLEQTIQKKNRLYIHPFFDAMQQTCWSDSIKTGAQNGAVEFVDFYEGSSAARDPLDTNFVRAVRGENCRKTP